MTSNHNGWPIELQRVDWRLGHRLVLHDISLSLRPEASPIVILGENGAGKSHLLRLLHGLCTPSQGTIHWNNQPSPEAAGLYQRHLLLAAQQPPLRLRVEGYLDLCLRLRQVINRQQRIERALHFADLHTYADHPARQLSSGQRQRLMLALAHALDCQTLLLDEPTAHLDPIAAQRVMAMINDWRDSQRHLIMVSHDGGYIRHLARSVIFLNGGRLIGHWSADAFFDLAHDLPAVARRFRNSLGVAS